MGGFVLAGAVGAIAIMGGLAIAGRLHAGIKRFSWYDSAVACVSACGAMAFIPAFKLAGVATVAVIYAAAPILAAFLAWGILRERPSGRVMAASLVALGGVGVIMLGAISGGSIIGTGLVFAMTVCVAVSITMYRARPGTQVLLPVAMSCVLVLPVSVVFGAPLDSTSVDIAVLSIFGVVFALAASCLMAGAKYVPAGETALLSNIEVPLAPILGYLILGEIPAATTIVGGGIIIAAVVWSQR